MLDYRVAVISAKNHKRQRRKRQSVTAKREKSQTPKFLTAILTLPNPCTNFGVCDFSRLAVTDWRVRRWRLWFLALSNAPRIIFNGYSSYSYFSFKSREIWLKFAYKSVLGELHAAKSPW